MEEKKLKHLPIGKQTFKDLIKGNMLYVDKTKDIYNLLSSGETYYFLSRPRRFGKSLLISTLEEIFLGNKELFKDLYIYDKIEWTKHPIIRIDFTGLVYVEGIEGFKNSLLNELKNIGLRYKINLKEDKDYKLAFRELLEELSKINKVVILIDEYDKPIVEYIDDYEIRNSMRDIIKDFYIVLKESDKYIQFAFLTGVSKFSKISVFSGLNNLTDLTMDKNYSTMLGYTQQELEYYFEDRIKLLAEELETSFEEAKQELKKWYNGYSWDGKNFVYNPFSILNVLKDKMLNNYWFKSGTPTLLIKLIKEKEIDIEALENFEASDALLDSFEIDDIEVESLLFQTGYLTIKEIKNPKSPYRKYILNYPNTEVKESLLNNILRGISSSKNNEIKIDNIVEPIKKKYLLDELLEEVNEFNTHNEINISIDLGNETLDEVLAKKYPLLN